MNFAAMAMLSSLAECSLGVASSLESKIRACGLALGLVAESWICLWDRNARKRPSGLKH